MAIRYVKDFEFPSAAGYSDSQPSKVTGQMYAKGGKVEKVMHEFGEGKLHSGSKKGPKVTNPKQAIAIALSEAGKSKKGYAEGGTTSTNPNLGPGPLQMPSDEQINKENWNQRKAIRRAMGAKNTGKDTFAKGGMAHEDVAADKSLIKSMVKPAALKKAMGGQAVQMAKPNAVEASMKGQKKTGYADGGIASPLQQMARKSVPVAPRAPMIPAQAAPAAGGPRIGVGRSRSGKPNVGAIRAAMAKAATQSMPENAPGMMKKGGKVKC